MVVSQGLLLPHMPCFEAEVFLTDLQRVLLLAFARNVQPILLFVRVLGH